MSSKMYKFIPEGKKQETSAKLRLSGSPHFSKLMIFVYKAHSFLKHSNIYKKL